MEDTILTYSVNVNLYSISKIRKQIIVSCTLFTTSAILLAIVLCERSLIFYNTYPLRNTQHVLSQSKT